MEIDRTTSVPLYQQIKEYINGLIIDGNLAPGQRLPSEKELQENFGVSRITVRQALQELTQEEKIVRVPGKGSFVLEPKVEPLTALTSFSENMRAQGLTPSYRDAHSEYVDPPLKVANVLGMERGQKALHVHRLLLADNVPMAIQAEYLPPKIYNRNPKLFRPEVLNVTSLYNLLERELDTPLIRAEEYVDASTASPREAALLEIAPGNPVLVITRITFSNQEVPVEYVKLIFRADHYRYRVELFRPKK